MYRATVSPDNCCVDIGMYKIGPNLFLGALSSESVDIPDIKNGNRSRYFLSFSALKFVKLELKQRHSDLLWETTVFHEVRYQTSGCYS